ncbi:methyltransferase, FxLD system [Nocardiopsis alba]|uniref:methyltransferase, FxLD system n=1 Tax=Nocardiopsis alba TaxID=53437 RepID=UPI0033BBF285
MTDATTTDQDEVERLRAEMVERLVLDGYLVDGAVRRAMRTVPRHRFVPEVDRETAHAPYDAVVTKKNEHGVATSSVSAPQIQAMMLEQAALRPGDRVLEIGSGGCNAALIAEIVGEQGGVTTVDIDPEVTDRARRLLKETGYGQVRAICADASDGVPEHGPYDAIIVTVGAWDIPPGWVDVLSEGGRLVVPLRMRNVTQSLALEREGERLLSRGARICGFVPMQGSDEHTAVQVLLRGDESVVLRFDDEAPADPHALDGVLLTDRVEVWTGVILAPRERIIGLRLYLAATLPGFGTMTVDADKDTGPVAPTNPGFSMAAVNVGDGGHEFAYLVTRRTEAGGFEYGVHAFGPQGEAFAEVVVERLRAWDRDHRGGPEPRIELFPITTPVRDLPGQAVITKKHRHITFSWPTPLDGRIPPKTSEGE